MTRFLVRRPPMKSTSLRRKRSRSQSRNTRRTSWALQLEPLEDRTLLASGARITAITPTQVQNAVFDHIDVTFNTAINPTTFTTQDVVISGPSGPIISTGVSA